jgi:hypothetical protein
VMRHAQVLARGVGASTWLPPGCRMIRGQRFRSQPA